MPASVLLVDDERFARTLYADYLRAAGYAVEVAEDAPAAVRLAGARFDVLLTDIVMPGGDGLQLLADAKRIDPTSRWWSSPPSTAWTPPSAPCAPAHPTTS